MINDVEDAPDDALHPGKAARNPVSAADITTRSANLASFAVAAAAVLCYALLGWLPFMLGTACVVIGYLYSWRRVRLKTIAGLDLLSHAFMLAGLQFLCAYFTFERALTLRMVFPFIFLFAISLYGELYNELRDLDVDMRAGLRHTAITLGSRRTHWLMNSLLAIGVAAGAVTFLVQQLIPLWVFAVLAGMALLLIIPRLIKLARARHMRSLVQMQEPFQKPFEIAAAAALVIQLAAPWALSVWASLSLYGARLLGF